MRAAVSSKPVLTTLLVVTMLAAVAVCAVVALADRTALSQFESDGGAPSSSDAGHRILRADGMAPGDSRQSEITIANDRSEAAELLLRIDTDDRPGRFGGRLSERLELIVRRRGAVSYRGTIPSGELRLGRIRPGASRRFSLSVVFIEGARTQSDNVYQGSASTLDLHWRFS